MSNPSPRLLVFGAHPDDADVHAGGLAALYARAGYAVCFVSLTNGEAGHHLQGGAQLAQRRLAEAQAAARVIGIEYRVLANRDGELEPNLDCRRLVIGLTREFRPDLLLTHRLNDYHPDHRATSQLVQDAAYCVTVPNLQPLVPHLSANPVIAHFSDHFRKPLPFQPDVVISIDEVIARKWEMLHCHASQVYEWLPYNSGHLAQVPSGETERRAWLVATWGLRDSAAAERFRAQLLAAYGPTRGPLVHYAEAFEVSEYGAPLTAELRARLFP